MAGSQVPRGGSSPLGGMGTNAEATSLLVRKERLLSPREPATVKRYSQVPHTPLRPVSVRSGEGLAPFLCLYVLFTPPPGLLGKHIAPTTCADAAVLTSGKFWVPIGELCFLELNDLQL